MTRRLFLYLISLIITRPTIEHKKKSKHPSTKIGPRFKYGEADVHVIYATEEAKLQATNADIMNRVRAKYYPDKPKKIVVFIE